MPAQRGAHERYEGVELLEAVGVRGEGGEAADSVPSLCGPSRASRHCVASPQHLQVGAEVQTQVQTQVQAAV